MKKLSIQAEFWKYFDLKEFIVKEKSLNERLIHHDIFIGDILAGWEIMQRLNSDSVK